MRFETIRRPFDPIIRRILHAYWRWARGLTVGVRGLILDGEGRVFLVKHSYLAGWHLPGGGVEKGETLIAALERELREEGNIEVTEPPPLHAIYFNRRVSRRDHVALYVVRAFRQIGPPVPNAEIIAHGFFGTNELPADTSRATRERIAEVLTGRAPAEWW
ncbi:MAG TPA: NUDIX domain-containing protein [Xanthobacteraceae bacterium]|jgi:8-oxo-dGTP pyrophosphatase MutT (NUDIX family)|nr:NUDIX domain-containing protein [Xanthobacteraceae bacterium]